MDNRNYLFVYGTLKKGKARHEILEEHNAEFVDYAILEGYDMYDTGYYPAIAIVKGKGIIHGEVYLVSDELIEILDAIEGTNYNLFNRKVVPVTLVTKKIKLYVFVYVFAQSVDLLNLIKTGYF